jgi:L-2,4-diaminobutyrate decarboxylase
MRKLIDWTAARAGLGPLAGGMFTSDGTESTRQALLLARARTAPEAAGKLRVLVSEAAHPGVRKAARALGLGPGAVVPVPVDRHHRMHTVALARELERCLGADLVPPAVVATAGTPDLGAIDPLPETAALCARYGAWLHVDAGHGCGLFASAKYRDRLAGVERADSVAVDYGTAFFQPAGPAALLVRDAAVLRHPAAHPAAHPAVRPAVPDVLHLWRTLRILGTDGVGQLFDEVCDLAAEGWRLLAADPRFDVVAEPALSTLVFRYIPAAVTAPAGIDRANLYARKALFTAGDPVVAGAEVAGRHYLRLTLLDPATTPADLTAVFDLIAGHAERYLGERLVRAS